jgi:hypothetical protein
VTDAAVEQTRRVLSDEPLRRRMVDHNYELGRRYFSYRVLQRSLDQFMATHQWVHQAVF